MYNSLDSTIGRGNAGKSVSKQRITMGLVITALIVGAAMLTRVETSSKNLRLSGTCHDLLLHRRGAGLWFVFHMLFKDKTSEKK